MTDIVTGDLADVPDMDLVLPNAVAEVLQGQLAALVSSGRPVEQLPALIVTWLAPMLATRDRKIEKLEWLHAEAIHWLDQTRALHREDLTEIAELTERLASVGRGMSRLLGELADARQRAGLDGAR